MIPADQHPHVARFKNDDGSRLEYSEHPVIAWDDDGYALIVDADRGFLKRANSYKNFDSVVEGEFVAVAAVPGQGWRAVYERPDGSKYTDPTIAWKIQSNGYILGVGQDSRDGVPDDQSHSPNFVQYLAPGEELDDA